MEVSKLEGRQHVHVPIGNTFPHSAHTHLYDNTTNTHGMNGRKKCYEALRSRERDLMPDRELLGSEIGAG